MTKAQPLGFWTATALVVGSMIGSGIFLLPAAMAPFGAASLLGWALATAGAVALAIVFAHLARRFPISGGPYAYARLAFGDFVGFLIAWGYWVSIACGNASIAISFAGGMGGVDPALTATPARAAGLALFALWACTIFNLMGVRAGGLVQTAVTAMKLLPLILVPLLGLFWFRPELVTPFNPSGQPLLAVTSATAALALFSFLGLEAATIPAEHFGDAPRTMSRATLVGTAIGAIVTVAVCTIALGLLPASTLANSGAPFSDIARTLWGENAGRALGAASALAAFGCINGWVLLQGQLPLAAARDGLFPRVFARVDSRGTPSVGLVLGTVLATALVVANYNGTLVKIFTFAILLTTAVTLLPYLVCSLAIFELERRDAREAAGTPLQVVAALAAVFSAWALYGTGGESIAWTAALLALGLPVYWVRRRDRGADAANG